MSFLGLPLLDLLLINLHLLSLITNHDLFTLPTGKYVMLNIFNTSLTIVRQ